MMRFTRTLAVTAALLACATALGQDDTGGDSINLLGAFAPILVVIAVIIWGIWGGFRLIPFGG